MSENILILAVCCGVLILYGMVALYGNYLKKNAGKKAKEVVKGPEDISELIVILKDGSSHKFSYKGKPNFGANHHLRRFAKWWFTGTTPSFTIPMKKGKAVISRDGVAAIRLEQRGD